MSSLFGTRSKDLKIIEEQEANLEQVIQQDSIGIVRRQAQSTAPQAIGEIYIWLATLPVDQERWKAAADLLMQGGIFKLCGGDELVQGLAFLGVLVQFVGTSTNSRILQGIEDLIF